jgi:tetratricopeptide (TPR) repeat protein
VAAVAAFALATLAKGMTLTLPVVLLACAWWQRGRIQRVDLLRILPFVLIAAAMVVMEVYEQHISAQQTVVRSDGLLSRTAVAGCAVWFYLWKAVWPVNLMFVYPRWNLAAVSAVWFAPGLLLAAIVALAWWQRGSWGRPVLMSLVCYVALLLPVLGFVNIYFMEYSLVADHWQYAAMIVPCAAFAGVATAGLGRRWGKRGQAPFVRSTGHRPEVGRAVPADGACPLFPAARAAGLCCLALLGTLATLTWRQSRMYADVETLYRTTIDRNPDCLLAHYNLGNLLVERGQIDEAIGHLEKVVAIEPSNSEAHNNLGAALARRGQLDEAMRHYQRALELKPGFADAHNNLGAALVRRGQLDEAMRHYQRALELRPDYAEAHNNWGAALARRGRLDEAMRHYQRALEIKPDYAEAHNNLGAALAARGRIDEAIGHYQQALQINPSYAQAHYNLGLALAARGRTDEAAAHYRTALVFARQQNNAALAGQLEARLRP